MHLESIVKFSCYLQNTYFICFEMLINKKIDTTQQFALGKSGQDQSLSKILFLPLLLVLESGIREDQQQPRSGLCQTRGRRCCGRRLFAVVLALEKRKSIQTCLVNTHNFNSVLKMFNFVSLILNLWTTKSDPKCRLILKPFFDKKEFSKSWTQLTNQCLLQNILLFPDLIF